MQETDVQQLTARQKAILSTYATAAGVRWETLWDAELDGLERDGFIEQLPSNHGRLWHVTDKGREAVSAR